MIKLRANRALFEQTIARVNEEKLLEALGKDILAHLTAWEQRMVG